MLKFKKGDQVKVVAGKDKGKTGEVIRVSPKDLTVTVKGANLYKRAVKATQNREGGMISMERPLSFAKVSLLENGKPVRAGFSIDGKKKLRVSKKTGGNL